MNPFRKAFLWTAVPITLVSVMSTELLAAWLVAAGMLLVALVTGVLFFTDRNLRGSSSGIMAGVAVGIIALTGTCFANLSTLGFR